MSLLRDVRVLDLTHQVAGPFCTQLLADLGADVLKVEPPGRGDGARDWPEFGPSVFLALNRNKRSLAVDLRDARGQRIVEQLAAKADILVENFAPGVMAKLHLAYGRLSEVNPRLIYCSIAGYHSRSQYAEQAAWDPVIQARSGLMSVTGEPDGAPVRIGASLVDMGAGLYATIAILAALYDHVQTRRGRWIEVPLFDCAVSFMGYWLVYHSLTGRVPPRTGSGWLAFAPYRAYRAGDGFVFIAASDDVFWQRLCAALKWNDLLTDPRYSSAAQRAEHRMVLDAEIEARLRTRTVADVVADLAVARVPCAPLNTVADLAVEPDLMGRAFLRQLPAPDGREVLTAAMPLYFADDAEPLWRPPPRLGGHTRDVLADLGYGMEDIRGLEEAGVVATGPR